MNGSADDVKSWDAVIVGSGVAGLSTALAAGGLRVALLTKGHPTSGAAASASAMALGGVAAAVGEGDSPAAHAADTMAAAAGLAESDAVRILTAAGPRRIAELVALGTRFDRTADGALALGREAAHGRPRILHAGGDASGAELVRALGRALVERRAATLLEGAEALSLLGGRGGVVGVAACHADGSRVHHLAPAVVLATGGVGALYSHTTNPLGATGDGLALAARAGARLADLEFVQFHPTALAAGGDPLPLVTEALRGQGATLVDERGRRFMTAVHPDAELAPRDVVARAIWELMAGGGRAFLDLTELAASGELARFTSTLATCREQGLDPFREPLPVAPAAHYHMGGIEVDGRGRTSVPGLWACGEVARTGVHGANRLASNSLLEGLVFGQRVGCELARVVPELPRVKSLVRGGGAAVAAAENSAASVDPEKRAAAGARMRELMWRHAGLVRSRGGLRDALALFETLGRDPATPGGQLLVARLIATAALAREESRGGHWRSDFPAADPALAGSSRFVVRDGAIEPADDSAPVDVGRRLAGRPA